MRLAEKVLLQFSRDPGSADLPSGGTASNVGSALRQLTDPFPDFLSYINDRDVLDFGCGRGLQAVAMAVQGARTVTGIDISEAGLKRGREEAIKAGVADRVSFCDGVTDDHAGKYDVAISLNSMEHFSDPQAVLNLLRRALRPGGLLVVTFSPPWYAPYGSHMYFFTRVPWVHLIFSEQTVMNVRSRFRVDGASRYEDVEGGLNRMSLAKFQRLIRQSGFSVRSMQLDAVKGLHAATSVPVVRELLTNRISCILERSE